MSTNWKTGDRALRISECPSPLEFGWQCDNGCPRKGTIYLVFAVVANPVKNARNETGLLIDGLPKFWKGSGREYGWNARNFRKVFPACDRIAVEEKVSL